MPVCNGTQDGRMRRCQVMDALAANEDVVLRIDVQGAATVRGMMPDAVSIFLVRLLQAEVRAASVAYSEMHTSTSADAQAP